VTPLVLGLTLLAATQAPPVFRAGVDLVRVDVLVTHKGAPVRGLTAADFEVRDGGRVQALEPVREEETPLDVVLVLDLSHSVAGPKLVALRVAAGAFLDGLESSRMGFRLASGSERVQDRAALLVFHEQVHLLEPPTVDLDRVRRALSTATPRGSTALYDAVYSGLRLIEPGARRTAVVVFSDGVDSVSWLTAPQVVEAAQRSDALVYAVTARRRGDPDNPFLRDVTRATGGRVWTARDEDELKDRFLDVLSDIRSRYVLSYPPEGVDFPGWHVLEVRLKQGKGEVQARPGYLRAVHEP
jgi:VWFA-related protein